MAGRWITPDGAPPTGSTYRLIRLPDDVSWQAPFWGALAELLKEHNWETLGGYDTDLTAAEYAALYEEWRMPSPFIGSVFAHCRSQAPSNSLPCDGATYNRSDYPDLYDALDAAFRVGSTQLTVPDLRGRTVVGDGQGSGLVNRVFAVPIGADNHTLTVAEMPSHTHGDTGHSHGYNVTAAGVVPAGPLAPVPVAFPPVFGLTANSFANLSNTGGGGAHSNYQPSLALHYAIWAR